MAKAEMINTKTTTDGTPTEEHGNTTANNDKKAERYHLETNKN